MLKQECAGKKPLLNYFFREKIFAGKGQKVRKNLQKVKRNFLDFSKPRERTCAVISGFFSQFPKLKKGERVLH
ncbi:MAG: hypothetical protein PHO84_00335 [Dysgonamonadaceae bacterium]|jgi:hypothetical protein|nr:hypothetical protein [Dysgonamonadaceae bacterium]MDD4245586.1 hypothetical protein [Dysgonamonadaceae bacterium]MDD4605036.1 hypothetical protein [Dysgonamonadaceae bacterium]